MTARAAPPSPTCKFCLREATPGYLTCSRCWAEVCRAFRGPKR